MLTRRPWRVLELNPSDDFAEELVPPEFPPLALGGWSKLEDHRQASGPRAGAPDSLGRVVDGGGGRFDGFGRLVAPAALHSRPWPDLRKGLPEAKSAVSKGQLGFCRNSPRLEVEQDPFPRPLALAVLVRHGDEFLLAVSGGAHDHQSALTVLSRRISKRVPSTQT